MNMSGYQLKEDRNMLLLIVVDRARYQVVIEGDNTKTPFSISSMNLRLLNLGHTLAQSVNILTFKKI